MDVSRIFLCRPVERLAQLVQRADVDVCALTGEPGSRVDLVQRWTGSRGAESFDRPDHIAIVMHS